MEVEVIKAKRNLTDRSKGKKIDRMRVAAYCRVSTDSEDQLHSYRSQLQYYTDLIEKNKEWVMTEVYADEAITGTQITKREGFQKMISDCMDGKIDMVITKSISRFARNTLDTLKYVRLLKENNIAIEKEHEIEDEIIKTIYYEIKPMAPEDAKLELEGKPKNNFLVFINIDTQKVNVIYRLKDGKNFGLVEPEA